MGFHLATSLLTVLLQLPLHGGKGIANGHVHFLMGLMLAWLPARHQFVTRNGNVDTHVEQVPLLMVLMAAFDDDTASRDQVGEQPLQLIEVVAYIGFDGIRMFHIPESKL